MKTAEQKVRASQQKVWWWELLKEVVTIVLLVLVVRNCMFNVPTGSAEPTILVGDRIWGNKFAYYFDDVKPGDLVIFDDPNFIYDRSSSIQYLWQKYVGFDIPILGLKGGPAKWVKRVIAVPGDTIEGRIEHGKTAVYLNGKKLEEPYVNRLPLVHVMRERGLLPFKRFGPLGVPGFLQVEQRHCCYTYDPSVPFGEQPYYNIALQEVVVNPVTHEPIFEMPGSATLRDSSGASVDEFGPIVVPDGKYWVMGDSRKNSADSRMWLFLDKELIAGRASFIMYSLDSEEHWWGFDLLKHPIEFWTRIVRWNRIIKPFKKVEIA